MASRRMFQEALESAGMPFETALRASSGRGLEIRVRLGRQLSQLSSQAQLAPGRRATDRSAVLRVQLGEDRGDLAVLGGEAQRLAALDDDLA